MSSKIHNTNPFISRLKEYGYISSDAEKALQMKIQCIAKTKGSYIIKEGQIAPSFFVIERGLVRSFLKRDGQEITVWFGYENVPFASIASFFDNKPSLETIQCLEDCVFQYIDGKDLNELYKQYNEINTIGRKILEEYLKILDERSFSLQTQSAEDRYKALIQNEPEIIKRVPLGYIASYLGVSQETLSRVRRK